MILKRIIIPSAIWLSALVHIVIVYQSIELSTPEILHAPEPAFPMINAVVVEISEPEVMRDIPPPPVKLPEAPPIEEVAVEEPMDLPLETPIEEPAPPEEKAPVEPADNAVVVDESPTTQPAPAENANSVQQSSRVTEGPPTDEYAKSGPAQSVPEKVFLPFYRVEKRPTFIYQPELRYPQQAKRQRIEGAVIIDADIDENGTLIRTKVVKEAGFGFEEAAVEMLEASEFSPAIIDGRPVAVRMRFTIEFRLD